ncbi:hypothetical protein [Streptomyces luteireticuli]|uniref:Uncharacterized protein n=1 Tax=Streptomyces luteireticuli TaxID=173858 RepID=A0ABN0Y9Y0_9ACTN
MHGQWTINPTRLIHTRLVADSVATLLPRLPRAAAPEAFRALPGTAER